MSLSSGTRFGPYEILSPLGEGGMGEVYRGRDSKLGRDVALKVLPQSLATDAEYIARFHREAQVLASLNHTNIAAIYGLEGPAIVMELVEGPTLADRIAQGPLPLDEALAIARQIAEALEYAHEKNVIHRDLKPANVKVTPDGVVKVLDFGLAKIAESTSPQGNPTVSPTLTVRAATQAGLILGTAAYMAPEQARGQAVDRRADIWAFGAVLFEMLSGKMAFPGDNITDILASVVKLEPEWNDIPPSTPLPIRKLITRCLSKDRKRRLQAIGEARFAIEEYAAEPAPAAVAATPPPQAQRPWPWMAFAGILLIALAAVSVIHFRETVPPERVLRYSIAPPEKSQINSFALSPDGRHLAIAASEQGKRRLWLRALESQTMQELRGTDDAMYPFWSPDNRHIGFFASGKLKRISIDNGPVLIVCDAADGRGGSWNQKGVIVFAPTATGALQSVSAAGGVPSILTKVVDKEIHRFPVFLPDGRRFLYLSSAGPKETVGLFVGSLDKQPARRLISDESSAAWLPPSNTTSTGYLLFNRDSTVMAQPFHPDTLQPEGEMFPVADQVTMWNRNHMAASISSNGMLIYWGGPVLFGENQLTWYDRSGHVLGKAGAVTKLAGFALSRDDTRIAESRGEAGHYDIWIHEVARNVDTRFTFDGTANRSPVWSPDGSRLAYLSFRTGSPELYVKDTSGTGQDELLLKRAASRFTCDWSRDGHSLLYSETGSKGRALWTVNMGSDRKPTLYLDTPFNETQGQFSPDGRWVAYATDESGRFEIYVSPFPSGAGKWKISTNGGELPRWNHDGKELFFLSPDRQVMAVTVKVSSGEQPSFSAGSPQLLFDGHIMGLIPGYNYYPYAVSADGKRFLVSSGVGAPPEAPLSVVVNWLGAVKK